MPWKGEKDPYRIWLSEVMLQQTRVEQGTDYYNRFIKKYPSVEKLAAAPDNEVFKLWEGLGYYSRCRNLLAAARHIAFDLKGKFPQDYHDILKLKGVGPYTAAAIASFAFEQPYAVTDGNVFRVLARFFGIAKAVDSTEGKKYFAVLSQSLLDTSSPAVYNQAIMDFGAVICKPKQPLCLQCPVQKECTAFAKGKINKLPVKEKKIIRRTRHFIYVVAEYGNLIYLHQRTEKDIWQGLWEFILFERKEVFDAKSFIRSKEFISLVGTEHTLIKISRLYKQQLTHQNIEGIFIHIQLKKKLKGDKYLAINKKDLKRTAFPRLINDFLEEQ